MRRKTTKMAEFCNWVGRTRVRKLLDETDGHAAPERTDDAAEAAEHDAGIHDDDVFKPDEGVERIVWCKQPPGNGGDADAERKCDAVREIDVDADIGGRRRVIGGRAQGLAQAGAADQHRQRDDDHDRKHGGDDARLVDEDFDKVAPQRTDDPGAARQRRLHRDHGRSEEDLAGILQDQCNAERQDKLRVMAFALEPRRPGPAHA